jgi:hypothetical protein
MTCQDSSERHPVLARATTLVYPALPLAAALTVSGLLLSPYVFSALVIPMTAAVNYIAIIKSNDGWRYPRGC